MSKTPLLRSLRRLFQEYRAAEASGLSSPPSARSARRPRSERPGAGRRSGRRGLLLGAGRGRPHARAPAGRAGGPGQPPSPSWAAASPASRARSGSTTRTSNHRLRGLRPRGRPHVHEHVGLLRRSGRGVGRRAHRHGPQDGPEARQAVRPAPRRPPRGAACGIGGHVQVLRVLLPQGPGRHRLRARLRGRLRGRGGRALPDAVRRPHGRRRRARPAQRPRLDRDARPRGARLAPGSAPRRGLRH